MAKRRDRTKHASQAARSTAAAKTGEVQKKPVSWPSWLPPLLLAFFTILLYWPVLSAQGVLFNDFIEQYYPLRVFATRALRQGHFPFWNPYVFSGMPFFADLQSAVLYPLNLMLVIFSSSAPLSALVYEYQIIAHVFLGGLGMYLLGRDLGLFRVPALCAGVVFMLGAFMTTHIFHVTMVHSYAWFPFAFLTTRRIFVRGKLRDAALTALLLGLIGVCGHPQLWLYIHLFLGAWVAAFVTFRLVKHRPLRPVAVRTVLFISAVLLGMGCAAVQLLPANRLAEESSRPTMEFSRATEGSFRPYRLVTLVLPDFFGTPNEYKARTRPLYWGLSPRDQGAGAHYYWETAMYVGVVTLVCAFFAFFTGGFEVWFLAGAACSALLLAMGDSFFLYFPVYHLVPGVNRFRIPGRFAALFVLAMAPLAGFGLQWLVSRGPRAEAPRRRRARRLIYSVAGVGAVGALLLLAGAFNGSIHSFLLQSGIFGTDPAGIDQLLAERILPQVRGQVLLLLLLLGSATAVIVLRLRGMLSGRAMGVLLCGLVFFDLYLFGRGYATVAIPPDRLYPVTPLVRELQERGKKDLFRINMRNSKPGTHDIGGSRMLFQKNQGSVHRLFLMEGYNPLRLQRQLVDRRDRTLDLLNVRYKIQVLPNGRLTLVGHPGFSRAWLAHSCEVVESDQRARARLHEPDFDHRHSVILERAPQISLQADSLCMARGRVTIREYTINRITCQVTTPCNALLVLSEIYYPAWKARVDGRPAPVLRADYALRAIPVEAGTHTVICEYNSRSFQRGAMVSLGALIIVLAGAGYPVLCRRRRASHG